MLESFTLSTLGNIISMILDIGIMTIVVYFCLKVVRNNTQTIQIFKGILFIIIANGVSQILGLTTVEWLTDLCLNWGILALIIIFQPEIRGLLEKIGKTVVLSKIAPLSVDDRVRLVAELVKTADQLSTEKTGALISIEQSQSMDDFIKTGTEVGSLVSSELLCTIFQYGTPLHDGAVIIQGNKVAAASAYFPPTEKEFSSNYGARHRAAVGISEIRDCVTIIVSEETGQISITKEGNLIPMNTAELEEYLTMTLCRNDSIVNTDKNEKTLKDIEKNDEATGESFFTFNTLNALTKKKKKETNTDSETDLRKKRAAIVREKRKEKIDADEIVVPESFKKKDKESDS